MKEKTIKAIKAFYKKNRMYPRKVDLSRIFKVSKQAIGDRITVLLREKLVEEKESVGTITYKRKEKRYKPTKTKK